MQHIARRFTLPTAQPPPLSIADQRSLLEHDTSVWRPLSKDAIQRLDAIRAAAPGSWYVLPHLPSQTNILPRVFRNVGPNHYQVICLSHGKAVRAFDVTPNPPALVRRQSK
jgi:hypothetical protein